MTTHAAMLAAVLALAGFGAGGFAHAQGAPQSVTVQRTATVQSGSGYRASKLTGADVYDGNGGKIGTIDDLVLMPQDQGAFAILSVGGFLGMGKHLVAVPLGQLQISSRQIVLPADKDALKAMPTFSYAHD
ncbi:PRC-barrel domain-containing protein [Paraburkholderia caballeronis]|uniref:Sporulation protein YlmC, PRC-barrel domain family n=1 Tax=Paraburkholderia caballeronis TaxID=416943 RepID=A0A1H7FS62_9BURK|nr:PRC-barrel domain-containing protein [Paraburkholderia caballeronis]PXW24856.1 sporulation protein YlmC with PRC-barrel domain [Paraburkholderia caballeronis]PXX00586.1 sporulation protein YlmC with PRC-barrel domain [Paraburkholderia caballeronis]RAJ98649.1 sporulation protein YlmC with PRC-barrel domain [Paraburkholderia caballeronis]TDV16529.1 sporulation protein YlmC with PRC-barrel domain [Paraburkholderia caballeronis]TDV18925.1 sporulation protein YlmC with PRC-barrel domain [Parabur